MNINTNFPILVFLLLLVAIGCKNKTESSNEKEEIVQQNTIQRSPNETNWQGTYFGVLPCASCPGINTLITLHKDGTYERTVEYIESNDTPQTTKGMFSWDKVGRITIEGNTLLIEKNRLIYLDEDNKKFTGELADSYVLARTELEPPLDSNEGYYLQIFKGSDNKNYNIIFNTNPKIPTALIETKGYSKMLSQTEAWAKGAEYAGSNTNLRVQGNRATLLIEDNKIELKSKD